MERLLARQARASRNLLMIAIAIAIHLVLGASAFVVATSAS